MSGSTVTLTGTGPVALAATQAANRQLHLRHGLHHLHRRRRNPHPHLQRSSPAQTYGDQAFAVAATSPSTGAVTYTVTSGPATIAGSTVTLTGAGTVILSASQAADANYAAATASTNVTIAPATPTLTFASIPAKTYGNPAFSVSATSASSAPVTYTVTSGPATINGSTLTLTGAGPVTLAASQPATDQLRRRLCDHHRHHRTRNPHPLLPNHLRQTPRLSRLHHRGHLPLHRSHHLLRHQRTRLPQRLHPHPHRRGHRHARCLAGGRR